MSSKVTNSSNLWLIIYLVSIIGILWRVRCHAKYIFSPRACRLSFASSCLYMSLRACLISLSICWFGIPEVVNRHNSLKLGYVLCSQIHYFFIFICVCVCGSTIFCLVLPPFPKVLYAKYVSKAWKIENYECKFSLIYTSKCPHVRFC